MKPDRPSNAEIAARLARRNRQGGPTVADTVAEIRRTREELDTPLITSDTKQNDSV